LVSLELLAATLVDAPPQPMSIALIRSAAASKQIIPKFVLSRRSAWMAVTLLYEVDPIPCLRTLAVVFLMYANIVYSLFGHE
jgi:hypothetical protein